MDCKTAILFVFILVSISSASATNFFSQASGSWFSSSTWGTTSAIPGANDVVVINPGHIIDMNGATQVSIQRLWVESATGQNSALYGPDNGSVEFYVQDDIVLSSSGGGTATLSYGNSGTLITHVGDLSINAGTVYLAQNTIFESTNSNYNGYCHLYQVSSSTACSDFSVASSGIQVFISGSINLGYNDQWGGFNNCNLYLHDLATFNHSYFTNSQIVQQGNYTTFNTYANCHFRGTSVSNTAYITGPVAMMDNANTFYHLTIATGGSVWGNTETASILVITHNLRVEFQGLVSPGVDGTLAITLGGHFSCGGSYLATETYFNNDLSGYQYQQINQEPACVINGNFTNQDSELSLQSNLTFYQIFRTFQMGTLHLNNYLLIYVTASGGNIYGGNSCGMNYCHISSTNFNDPISLTECTIDDNSVVCNAGLTVHMTLSNNGYLGNTLHIAGQLYIPEGAAVNDLSINLNGNLRLQGSIVFSPVTFIGSSHDLIVYPTANIGSDIVNNCSTLRLAPIDTDVINFHSYNLSGDADSNFDIVYTLTMMNVRMSNTDFMSNNPDVVLSLANALFYNGEFDLQVNIVGPCMYNGSGTVFLNTSMFFLS